MKNPLRTLLGSVAHFAHARLELVGADLRDEATRLVLILLGGCAGLLLAALALGAVGAAVIIAAGEQRLLAATLLAATCLALAVYLALRTRRAIRGRARLFASTLAELERDRAALLEESRAQRANIVESAAEITRLVSIGMMAYSIGSRLRRGS